MLFNSWTFLLFILVVLPLYYRLPFNRQNTLLLVASYIFYAAWDWRFLGLLWLSTLVDFFIARHIDQSDNRRFRKMLLIASVCVNLGVLGFFKYFNFFADSTARVLTSIGFEPTYTTLYIVLPVGISFYTFQTMAYTIDVYRRRQPAISNIIDYALYVSYFPQLVAGPIERAQNLIPQIQSPRFVSKASFQSGIQLILWGYLKKVAIADSLAPLVSTIFDQPGQHDSFALLLGTYCFALQIYGDFSGYSDIARGISRLMGIELMVNFKQPYLARNITDFWRRWHISLSTWLRDYLYVPLGGNRSGSFNQNRNMMITMLLGGLWHGAGWNFILWGGLHGVYLSAHKLWTRNRKIDAIQAPQTYKAQMVHFFWAFITFNLVCLTWIPFRSGDFGTTIAFFEGLFQFSGVDWTTLSNIGIPHSLILYGLVVLILDLRCWYRDEELPFNQTDSTWMRGIAYAVGILILALVREGSHETFIYFQF